MRYTLCITSVAILALSGCDQIQEVANPRPTTVQSPPTSSVGADDENYQLDLTFDCMVSGILLDGTTIQDVGTETIRVERSRSEFGEPKNGVPQFYTISNAKITSNGKTFDSTLIGSSPDFVLIAYGNLLREGVASTLFMANYMIDLKTKRLKRTVSFFPRGGDVSFEGQCT